MSCMRLRHRSTVVLPHPEGPMNAVISLAAISSATSRIAVWPLYFTSTASSSKTSSRAGSAFGRVASVCGSSGSGTKRRSAGCTSVSSAATCSTVLVRCSSVRMGSSKGSGRLAAAEEGVHEPGEDRAHEHDQDEGERGAPRAVLGGGKERARVLEDLQRQRRVDAVEQAPVGVVLDQADGEEQRCRLTRGARNCDERAADD